MMLIHAFVPNELLRTVFDVMRYSLIRILQQMDGQSKSQIFKPAQQVSFILSPETRRLRIEKAADEEIDTRKGKKKRGNRDDVDRDADHRARPAPTGYLAKRRLGTILV